MPVKHPPFQLLLILLLVATGTTACGRLIMQEPERQIAALRPGAYQLDPAHTVVLFKVGHLGLSKFVGRFNEVEASLDFDPENIDEASLEALLDTASIDVDDADFEASLTSVFWLNSAEFPQASFRSLSIRPQGENSFRIQGELTFLGVARPLNLDAVFNGGAHNLLTGKYTLGFEAKGSFRRSDFGLSNYIPAVSDEVELEIHAEFQRM